MADNGQDRGQAQGQTGPLWGLLALLAPALLLWAGWQRMSEPIPWALDPVFYAMDKEIQRTRPEVLVIGPSFARTDIDGPTFSAALAPDGTPVPVSILTENAATGADWYGVLKHRVYAQGVTPRLVVVVATMGTLATSESRRGGAIATAHTPGPDPVLAAKSVQQSAFDRLLTRRSRLRDEPVDAARAGLVGLLHGATRSPAEGDLLVTRAAGVVFRRERLQGMAAPGRQLPVIEGEADLDEIDLGTFNPDQSFLPDLVDITRAAGSRLVVVLPPTTRQKAFGQRLSPDQEQAMLDYVRGLGIGWLDLRETPLADSAYLDGRHMSLQTARQFSRLVAERLQAIGALGDGPIQAPRRAPSVARAGAPAPVALSADAVRSGEGCTLQIIEPALASLMTAALHPTGTGATPPFQPVWDGAPLPPAARRTELEAGCAGRYSFGLRQILISPPEAGAPDRLSLQWHPDLPLRQGTGPDQWWVYPGTALTWTWEEAWAPPGSPLSVRVQGLAVGPGADPRLQIAGQDIALTPGPTPWPEIDPGRPFSADVAFDAPGSPLVLTLSAPADGAPWLVRRIDLLLSGEPVPVLAPANPRELSLFYEDVRYAAPPPAPPPAALSTNGRKGALTLPWSDRVGCNPFLVLEDGAPLPATDPLPGLRPTTPARKTWLDGDAVRFQASDNAPLPGGRTYTLQYREDRACQSLRWLLPGDTLTATLTRKSLNPGTVLAGPPRRLLVSAASNQELPADGWIKLLLLREDGRVVEAQISSQELLSGKEWALAPVEYNEGLQTLTLKVSASEGMPGLLLDIKVMDG